MAHAGVTSAHVQLCQMGGMREGMPPRSHIQHPVALPELDGNMRVLIGVIPIFFLPISVRKTRDEKPL
jgi:hypothetical protein